MLISKGKMQLDLKVSIFNSLTNLDVNWNTYWALFSVVLPTAIHNPLQSDSFS